MRQNHEAGEGGGRCRGSCQILSNQSRGTRGAVLASAPRNRLERVVPQQQRAALLWTEIWRCG